MTIKHLELLKLLNPLNSYTVAQIFSNTEPFLKTAFENRKDVSQITCAGPEQVKTQ